MSPNSSADLVLERFLHPFDLRQVPGYRFDVVVLGSGAGGSLAALSAASGGASVAILAKGGLHESNTNQAQGGVAAVLSRDDSFESHVADTLRVGCGLGEARIARDVIHAGPQALDELIELGAEFDRGSDGGWDLSREGGHTHARVVHAQGDATGLEIQRTVCGALERHPDITTFPGTFALDLLTGEGGRVVGVLARTERGDLVSFHARHVILATGGAGQIYRETTNPAIATGDGVAMAVRAGAVVRDMEFVQFHPTCLYIAGAARVLISEIVRGAGGILLDRHGVRFMPQYHPEAELAPRDVVSRGVFARMVATDDTNVYLDLSQIDGDPHLLFPGISRICRFFGIDIARNPIPVRPGAHYSVGGLLVDDSGRTSLPGLWAVGECASTGLHGANRMGSNSLLEALVLGSRSGKLAAADRESVSLGVLDPTYEGSRPSAAVDLNIVDLTYSLKSMMWRQMGVERVGAGLEDALAKLTFWSRAVRRLSPDGHRGWELSNMLSVAHLATIGAHAREESRGVHFRTDYPDARPEWQAHTNLIPRYEHLGGPVTSLEIQRERLQEALPAS